MSFENFVTYKNWYIERANNEDDYKLSYKVGHPVKNSCPSVLDAAPVAAGPLYDYLLEISFTARYV